MSPSVTPKGTAELIKRHEGLRLTPYKCPTGHWTVGYGHNLEVHGEPIPDEISRERAEQYLMQDIVNARHDLESNFSWYGNLSDARRAALIDLCFNMGIGALLGFKRMLEWLRQGFYGQAKIELLDSRYARQVGGRAREIAQMIETGNWPAWVQTV